MTAISPDSPEFSALEKRFAAVLRAVATRVFETREEPISAYLKRLSQLPPETRLLAMHQRPLELVSSILHIEVSTEVSERYTKWFGSDLSDATSEKAEPDYDRKPTISIVVGDYQTAMRLMNNQYELVAQQETAWVLHLKESQPGQLRSVGGIRLGATVVVVGQQWYTSKIRDLQGFYNWMQALRELPIRENVLADLKVGGSIQIVSGTYLQF